MCCDSAFSPSNDYEAHENQLKFDANPMDSHTAVLAGARGIPAGGSRAPFCIPVQGSALCVQRSRHLLVQEPSMGCFCDMVAGLSFQSGATRRHGGWCSACAGQEGHPRCSLQCDTLCRFVFFPLKHSIHRHCCFEMHAPIDPLPIMSRCAIAFPSPRAISGGP